MLAPATVEQIPIMVWDYIGSPRKLPAVFHCAWQSPDCRLGIVMANWTTDTQHVHVTDPRLQQQVIETISAGTMIQTQRIVEAGNIAVSLPPLSILLIENM